MCFKRTWYVPRSCHLTDTLTYTHSFTYTHINTYTLTSIHKLTHMHTHTQINTRIHTETHTHTYRRGFKEYGIKCRFSGLKVKFQVVHSARVCEGPPAWPLPKSDFYPGSTSASKGCDNGLCPQLFLRDDRETCLHPPKWSSAFQLPLRFKPH